MTTNQIIKDEIAQYWSARAASFDASPGHGIASQVERASWLQLVAACLGPLQGCRVLELASGTGEFTGLLAEVGADVTGLDLCDAMLARARPKLEVAGHRASLFLGDAEDTREPPGAYRAGPVELGCPSSLSPSHGAGWPSGRQVPGRWTRSCRQARDSDPLGTTSQGPSSARRE